MIDLIKFGTVNIRLAAMMWVWIEGLDSRPANFVMLEVQVLEKQQPLLGNIFHGIRDC